MSRKGLTFFLGVFLFGGGKAHGDEFDHQFFFRPEEVFHFFQLENLGVIDILIVPVGGSGYTLDATSAVALVRTISPKVVVPIHYADSGISYEVPQDSAEVFVKEMGAPVENVSKLKVKNDSSLPTVLTTYILSRTR